MNRLKQQLTDQYNRHQDISKIKKEFEAYFEDLQKESLEFQKSQVNTVDNREPEHQYLFFFEEDKKALSDYHNLVYKTRPEMIKQTGYETDYDWDFEIDLDNYDPWREYRMIYKDLFQKGRAYWIIKSMPEWKFLQIGSINSCEDESTSEYNPKRPNMNDSIFNILAVDRYFETRYTKSGIGRGKSQAVRI